MADSNHFKISSCNVSFFSIDTVTLAFIIASVSFRKKEKKQGFLSQFTDAIDFAQVRSDGDRDLLDKAKSTLGGKRQKGQDRQKMSKEQYQALRRKVGGTAR
jgi:hypothetical protein